MDFQGTPLGSIALNDSWCGSFRSTSSEPSTPGPVARRVRRPGSPIHPPHEDAPPAPYLCHACLSILTMDGLDIGKPYSHHDSLKSLLAAHQMGCNICYYAFRGNQAEDFMVLAEGCVPMTMPADKDRPPNDDAFSSNERSRLEIQEYWRYSEYGKTIGYTEDGDAFISFTGLWVLSKRTDSLTICIRLNPSYAEFVPIGMQAYQSALWESWKSLAYQMWAFCEKEVITARDFAQLGIPTSLPCNTGSTESWATVAQWLQECDSHHRCLAHIDRCWYPTRLVECTSERTFRVIRSEFANPGRGYITLSHKWGDRAFLKLTQDQLPAFEKGLPITELRKTFQDTLVIAKRMSIPYVWIDSLCIIQSGDNGVDWQRECGTMSDVYSNSLCNLSADWANEDDGLFFERNFPGSWYGFKMRLKTESPELREKWQSCYLVQKHKWIDNFLTSPLNNRGWVMQERLLAPRVLHFSPQQMSWECTRMLRSEYWPTQSFRSSSLKRLAEGVDACCAEREIMERVKLHDASKDWNQDNLMDWWYDCMEHYTACCLTKRSDKLIAVSGFAKKLCPLVKDRYAAGLWEKSLPMALVWTPMVQSTTPFPQCYAPTFSWAAADGSCIFRISTDRYGKEFLLSTNFVSYRKNAHIPAIKQKSATEDVLLTNDVLGLSNTPEVEIRARGILRSCRIRRSCEERSRILTERSEQESGERMDDVWSPRGACLYPDSEGDPFRSDLGIHYDRAVDREAATDNDILYYAPIAYEESWDHPMTVVIEEGLLLRSVDASMGRFERVGTVHVADVRNEWPKIKPSGNEKSLPAWSYDEVTGEHTFYIV